MVEREDEALAPATPEATAAAADSTRAIMTKLLARLATEPVVVGSSIATNLPWEGAGAVFEAEGVNTPAQRATVITADTSFLHLFGVRVLAGRIFAAGDAALPPPNRPVIVNRSFVTEILGGGAAVGRRVRYRSFGNDVQPWITISGVVEDFPSANHNAGGTSRRNARVYHLAAPDELSEAVVTIRLRGQTPAEFAPRLRSIAASVDPMLQLSGTSGLDVMYRDYAKSGVQLALVVALIAGSVLLLSSAGIHALMSFTVNQRQREIGIRTALGAPARRILRSVLARATRQVAVGIGLVVAVAADVLSGGELMDGTGMVLIPLTAAFMLVVGLLAAAGPARRGLGVQPTEALRAD